MVFRPKRARRVRLRTGLLKTANRLFVFCMGYLFTVFCTSDDTRRNKFVENVTRALPRVTREIRRRYFNDWDHVLSKTINQTKYELSDDNLHVNVISVKRLGTRVDRTLGSLVAQSIPWRLHVGVDGLGELDKNLVRAYAGKNKRKWMELTAGMDGVHLKRLLYDYDVLRRIDPSLKKSIHERLRFGCYMSHVSLWQYLLQEGLPFVVVLEDDVVLEANFSIKLRSRLRALPIDWDVLYLNSCFRRFGPVCGVGIRQAQGALCTFGYVVSAKGARHLMQHVANSEKPIDHVLDHQILTGRILAYHSDPPIVSLLNMRSTLAY